MEPTLTISHMPTTTPVGWYLGELNWRPLFLEGDATWYEEDFRATKDRYATTHIRLEFRFDTGTNQ